MQPSGEELMELEEAEKKEEAMLCWPLRYTVVILCCMSVVNLHAHQMALQSSLPCMLNGSQLIHQIVPLEFKNQFFSSCHPLRNISTPTKSVVIDTANISKEASIETVSKQINERSSLQKRFIDHELYKGSSQKENGLMNLFLRRNLTSYAQDPLFSVSLGNVSVVEKIVNNPVQSIDHSSAAGKGTDRQALIQYSISRSTDDQYERNKENISHIEKHVKQEKLSIQVPGHDELNLEEPQTNFKHFSELMQLQKSRTMKRQEHESLSHQKIPLQQEQTEKTTVMASLNHDETSRKLVALRYSDPVQSDASNLWTPTYQWVMVNAFSGGCLVTLLCAGWLVTSSSGYRLLGYCHLAMSLASLLIPVASLYMQPYVVVVVQIFSGLSGGVTYPCLMKILFNWTTQNERASLMCICFCGIPLAVIIDISTVQVTCYMYPRTGWICLFILLGIFGVCWFILWTVFVSSRPATSSWLSSVGKKSTADIQSHADIRILWKQLMRSCWFWSLVMVHVATDWSLYMITCLIPVFLRDVFKLNLHTLLSGYFSTAPVLMFLVTILISGYAMKYMTVLCSMTNSRRSYLIIGAGTISSCLILLTTLDYQSWVGIVISLVFIGGGVALLFSGSMLYPYQTNLDLAPVIIGLSLTFTYIFRISMGTVVNLVTSEGDIRSWSFIMYGSAIFISVSVSMFTMCGNGVEEFSIPSPYSSHLLSTDDEVPESSGIFQLQTSPTEGGNEGWVGEGGATFFTGFGIRSTRSLDIVGRENMVGASMHRSCLKNEMVLKSLEDVPTELRGVEGGLNQWRGGESRRLSSDCIDERVALNKSRNKVSIV